MIAFLRASGLGHVIVANTVVMLEELLKLRKKVRNDAIV